MLALSPAPLLPSSSSSQTLFASNSTPIVNVLDFGADPTGKTDSTAAFQAAVAVLLTMGSGHQLSNGEHLVTLPCDSISNTCMFVTAQASLISAEQCSSWQEAIT